MSISIILIASAIISSSVQTDDTKTTSYGNNGVMYEEVVSSGEIDINRETPKRVMYLAGPPRPNPFRNVSSKQNIDPDKPVCDVEATEEAVKKYAKKLEKEMTEGVGKDVVETAKDVYEAGKDIVSDIDVSECMDKLIYGMAEGTVAVEELVEYVNAHSDDLKNLIEEGNEEFDRYKKEIKKAKKYVEKVF